MSVVVNAKGRTGVHRSNLKVRATYDEESKTISLRADDAANLEFWLEASIPYPQPESRVNNRMLLKKPDVYRDKFLEPSEIFRPES